MLLLLDFIFLDSQACCILKLIFTAIMHGLDFVIVQSDHKYPENGEVNLCTRMTLRQWMPIVRLMS